ncbi:MAG: DEAD/DEAH box helicase [bacterium]|nr:DEAD/DEAH box helicase [bacterium]
MNRLLEVERVGDDYLLVDVDAISQWKLFRRSHSLSPRAQADRQPGDDRSTVSMWWAAPVDRLDPPRSFWAFFPTETVSLVAGILNAPWKTNEDRQNLLRGPYNRELIDAAAEMIADALPELATDIDPARHLDALPHGQRWGDPAQATRLRKHLFRNLYEREIVPNQDGRLRVARRVSLPPKQLTPKTKKSEAAFEQWASYPARPTEWLHHSALTRTRIAAVDRLFDPDGEPSRFGAFRRATVERWLEALVEDADPSEAVAASMAAIRTAVLIPEDLRVNSDLGKIVLTADHNWRSPDPLSLFLPNESGIRNGLEDRQSYVHPDLVSESETRAALRELGLKTPSRESIFRQVAMEVIRFSGKADGTLNRRFWVASRRIGDKNAYQVIREQTNWNTSIRVRTKAGQWAPLHSVLLPGVIVPDDGSRDGEVAVDTEFHEKDKALLRLLGVSDKPQSQHCLSDEPSYGHYEEHCEKQYRGRDDLPSKPHRGYLVFTSSVGVGPVNVLTVLSDEARALYTDAALRTPAVYEPWLMWHKGSNRDSYPKVQFESLTAYILRSYGRLRIHGGIVPLADALGPHPADSSALLALLKHPDADRIKALFDLSDPTPEILGEQDPIPLTDEWPGLNDYLPPSRRTCHLVSCESILVAGQERSAIFQVPNVYLAKSIDDDEGKALRLVIQELDLGLTEEETEAILQRRTPGEVEERRKAIRQLSTDAERLLAAVGEDFLRGGLPRSLIRVLEINGDTLTGTDIASAAIATYHTDALRQYRHVLGHLDPPVQWAASARAVAFVRSLGFSSEWAGERNKRLSPYLEVEGPHYLPPLHGYQKTIAKNVRAMLANGAGKSPDRRGMISLPTGSGKTRVAVQAIVEAIREDGFRGNVLWVAHREELCEQAVEAWRQVWASLGAETQQLRISRLWDGQHRPQPTDHQHVIVATIQTLHARLSSQPRQYRFLQETELVIFDEAHRSLAPTSISVMQEIGMTIYPETDEPFLIGLTATPYRGRDKRATARLARRYGHRRLDAGAFKEKEPQAVVTELQDMQVLAQADHETIPGSTFQLNTKELEIMSRFLRGSGDLERRFSQVWLPQSAEERIAGDAERTKRILDAYDMHVPSEWPTLIFATSVEHAQTVAALLNRRGTNARAVSAGTEPATRRRIVQQFRDGRIQALVNYGVFTEGFDAPKTRAIIVARPVYSPNLYFQMIGRGLRGPRNGGDDRCLILNVHDNIENYNRALAFSDLDWLWAS